MLNWQQVFTRIKRQAAFREMNESDFRPCTYVQTFTPAAGGSVGSNLAQNFPGGAIVLGISAGAFVPSAAAADGQSSKNRQLFLINFTYSNNEALTPGGPVLADVLMGGGDADLFPARELVMAPNQTINCQVANITTGLLTVHVAYQCMVYRFAS